MIEQQIRPWEVLDPQVLALLDQVKREDFAPAAHKALAFTDMALPLTQPAVEGQAMLPPRVEARMLQDVVVQATDKVLEIGTGSGYMAALLAKLAERVVSLEIDESLAGVARSNLQRAGISNVEVRVADAAANGFAGLRHRSTLECDRAQRFCRRGTFGFARHAGPRRTPHRHRGPRTRDARHRHHPHR